MKAIAIDSWAGRSWLEKSNPSLQGSTPPLGDRKRRERPHLAHSLAVKGRECRRLVYDQVDGPKRILCGMRGSVEWRTRLTLRYEPIP
jgi:hypothetical protein